MSGTMISDTLHAKEIANTKIFFILEDAIGDAVTAQFDRYTKETGVQFLKEKHGGFWVVKKVVPCEKVFYTDTDSTYPDSRATAEQVNAHEYGKFGRS